MSHTLCANAVSDLIPWKQKELGKSLGNNEESRDSTHHVLNRVQTELKPQVPLPVILTSTLTSQQLQHAQLTYAPVSSHISAGQTSISLPNHSLKHSLSTSIPPYLASTRLPPPLQTTLPKTEQAAT